MTPARRQFNALSRNATALSKILSDFSATATSSESTFAAFKVLPIDTARRQETSSGSVVVEHAEDMAAASTCKEMSDIMVAAIRRACEDVGGGQGQFVLEADVVR